MQDPECFSLFREPLPAIFMESVGWKNFRKYSLAGISGTFGTTFEIADEEDGDGEEGAAPVLMTEMTDSSSDDDANIFNDVV